jgi:hypothetical protein
VAASLCQLKRKFYRNCPLCDVSKPAGNCPRVLREIGFHADRLSAAQPVRCARVQHSPAAEPPCSAQTFCAACEIFSINLPEVSRPRLGSGGLSPAFDRRGRRSVLDESLETCGGHSGTGTCLGPVLRFPLSVSFYHCTVRDLCCTVLPIEIHYTQDDDWPRH